MKKLVTLLLLLLMVTPGVAQVKKAKEKPVKARTEKQTKTYFDAKVVGVKDGDTYVVLTEKKEQFVIRLAAVDCPEKKQNFGQKAKEFSSDQIFGKLVKVRIISKDKYGRNIAYIVYDKKDLSKELLKAGLAWHYKEYDKSNYLQSLENTARKNKVGLWIEDNPIRPSDFRNLKTKK